MRTTATPAYTYNQGVILAGLSQLSIATGNTSLLTTASAIATAATSQLASNGVLVDPCEPNGCANDGYSFKGIFVRDLGEFARATGTTAYNTFLARPGLLDPVAATPTETGSPACTGPGRWPTWATRTSSRPRTPSPPPSAPERR